MQPPFRIHYIAQQIEDIKVMFKIRSAGLEEKKEIFVHIGSFRSAVLMKLYWHMNHNDLLATEKKLKDQYFQLIKKSKLPILKQSV